MNASSPTPSPNSRLLRLIGLAHEATPATRHQLLDEIISVFEETAVGLSDKERDIFCLIIAQLAETLMPAERRALSARLARVPGTAPSLLRDLGPTESELIGLLRSGYADQFINAFARTTDIDPAIVRDIVSDPADGRLAEICHHAGLARATYSTIVLLSDPLALRPQAHTEMLLTLFESQSPTMLHATPHAA